MKKNVISVSQLTNEIKINIENQFSGLTVEGEISNFKFHSSGHIYFTLKDENAQISAVIWKYKNRLNFKPTDGMKVIVRGDLSLYPPQGKYQIDVDEMLPAGQGDLFLAYEALKKTLSEKGYFDEINKKPLPVFPQKIGVATSPTGAAVQDILTTITLRYKAAEVLFRPTLVQGEGASKDIVKAINELSALKPDLIIIGRGGGSLEDLWCFNELETIEAVFQCDIPIISAVGHETDFTLCDFVADFRAATPTTAAVLATPYTIEDLKNFLLNSENLNRKYMNSMINKLKDRFNYVASNKTHRRLQEKINLYNQKIDESVNTISKSVNMEKNLLMKKVESLSFMCKSLNPKLPLQKGYAILKDNKNNVIDNSKTLLKYKTIEIVRANENVLVKVEGRKNETLFE